MVHSGTPLPASAPVVPPGHPLHGVSKDPPPSYTCSSSCQPARATPAQRSTPAIHACQDFGPPAGGHHLRVTQNPQPTLTLAPDIPPGQFSAELKGTSAQACIQPASQSYQAHSLHRTFLHKVHCFKKLFFLIHETNKKEEDASNERTR